MAPGGRLNVVSFAALHVAVVTFLRYVDPYRVKKLAEPPFHQAGQVLSHTTCVCWTVASRTIKVILLDVLAERGMGKTNDFES